MRSIPRRPCSRLLDALRRLALLERCPPPRSVGYEYEQALELLGGLGVTEIRCSTGVSAGWRDGMSAQHRL